MFLLSWILYPVVLAALCLGCGLLVGRLARRPVPSVLLAPVGFAAVVVLATLLTVLDPTSQLAGPALAVAAVAGVALAVRAGSPALRPSTSWLGPVVAMAIPFAALAAPVVLTGTSGPSGYARIVDLASQIDLAAYLVDNGRSLADTTRDSSYNAVADQLLSAGYPAGAQAALGATAQVARVDVSRAWQPFMAWMGAMLALALYALLRGAIRHRAARAFAAGVAAQPTILYSYALVSGVKELAAALFVALTAALLSVAPPVALPAGLAIAAGLCAINVGIAPWVLVLLAVLAGPRLVAAARRGGRRRIAGRTWVLALVAIVVVATPAFAAAIKLAPLLRAGGPPDLGNLAAPLPAWSAIGPWLTSDHRYPLATDTGAGTATAILACFVAVLAAVGVARAIAQRDRGLYAAATAAVIAVAFIVVQGSAWVELKAFTISAPLIVMLAFAGAAALSGPRWRRVEATVVGAGVAASILAGNLLVYRNVPVVPQERFAELEELGERYAGQGPTLYPAFEEFAGYLMRDARLTALSDVPFEGLLRPQPGTTTYSEDLDGFSLAYLRTFKLIVVRRGDPTQSRPPSNWQLVRTTAYHDVYRRTAQGPAVLTHGGLPAGVTARPAGFCRALRADLRAAGAGARVAYVAPIEGAVYVAPGSATPQGWLSQGEDRLARGPGRMVLTGDVVGGGEFDVWIRGSFGRRVRVEIDGRTVGSVRWRQNYPFAYEPLGRVTLTTGAHRFDVVRGGGTVLPGTGNELGPEGIITRIGPVALTRPGPPPVVQIVSGDAGMDVCRAPRQLDWMEVVRAR